MVGVPVALALGAGFVPARKPGKLPRATISQSYELEYGTDTLEIHADALDAHDKVLVVDDLMATGGTLAAVGNWLSLQVLRSSALDRFWSSPSLTPVPFLRPLSMRFGRLSRWINTTLPEYRNAVLHLYNLKVLRKAASWLVLMRMPVYNLTRLQRS